MYDPHLIYYYTFDESSISQNAAANNYGNAGGNIAFHGAGLGEGVKGKSAAFNGAGQVISAENITLPAADITILFFLFPSEETINFKISFQDQEQKSIAVEVSKNWNYIALTKKGNVCTLYVNNNAVSTFVGASQLIDFSVFQPETSDIYLIDEFKLYSRALSDAEIAGNANQATGKIIYRIDVIDIFEQFGVKVSASSGVISKPKLKSRSSVSWDNYNGESVDLQTKYYEPREINLDCWLKADSRIDFIEKLSAFQQLLDKKGTNRLEIFINDMRPLCYEVYCDSEIAVEKKWRQKEMYGTFKLKLTEPEPIKRILRHIANSSNNYSCSITLTSAKLINVFWGDGTSEYDVSGENITVSHQYQNEGEYFPVIAGNIDEITEFTTNAIIIWNRL